MAWNKHRATHARDIGQTDVEQSQRGLSTEVIAIKQGLRQSVKALR